MRTMPEYVPTGGHLLPFAGGVVVFAQAWERGLIVAGIATTDNSTGVSVQERCRT